MAVLVWGSTFIIMISETQPKLYCKDDISLIENYEIAVNDQTQIWHCHHRRETIYTRECLIEIGEYYHRPACELIFLTKAEHNKLHHRGRHHSEKAKKKMSDAKIGNHNSPTRKILQYTKYGEFIGEWVGAREAGKVLGIDHSNITSCCQGKYKSAGGFKWTYA